jgi:hypothetical protein
MAKTSSNHTAESLKPKLPELPVKVLPPDEFVEQEIIQKQEEYERKETFHKNYYFDNETVERLSHRYVKTACTDIKLRDEIMVHASELIRQIIKAHNLGHIYPGKDDSSIMDLFQTAWLQIESALYKYEAYPHCSSCYNPLRPNDSLLSEEYLFEEDIIKKLKVCPHCKAKLTESNIYFKGKSKIFNMMSQVARTVILAYIKKENRDRKNSDIFRTHLCNRTLSRNSTLYRFFVEARELVKYNENHVKILDAIEQLYKEDDRAHEGLITKLVTRTGLSRANITGFFKIVRMRGHEFTDSPVNEQIETIKSVIDDDNET